MKKLDKKIPRGLSKKPRIPKSRNVEPKEPQPERWYLWMAIDREVRVGTVVPEGGIVFWLPACGTSGPDEPPMSAVEALHVFHDVTVLSPRNPDARVWEKQGSHDDPSYLRAYRESHCASFGDQAAVRLAEFQVDVRRSLFALRLVEKALKLTKINLSSKIVASQAEVYKSAEQAVTDLLENKLTSQGLSDEDREHYSALGSAIPSLVTRARAKAKLTDERLSPGLAVFNLHVNRAGERAEAEFKAQYGVERWDAEIAPYYKQGIMTILHREPNRYIAAWVALVAAYVNEGRK